MVSRFKCPFCSKRFDNIVSLDRHLRVVHHKSILTINSPFTFNVVLTIKIDDYTAEELKSLAAEANTSVSQFVRNLIYIAICSNRKGRKPNINNILNNILGNT